MTETEVLRVLKENYNDRIDSIEFIRQGGCVSYIVNCDNEKYFLKIIDNAFLDTAIQSIDIQSI